MYHVLVAVDTDVDRALSQVDVLEALPASADELFVTVVHVYEAVDAPADEAGSSVIDDVNRSIEDLRGIPESVTAVESRLDALAVAHDRELHVGEPADAIVSAATAHDADAISVGVRARTPVGKALFGSVGQAVLLSADRPVIVDRPE
jgi:nucleotide-binding universal stress UspA family protein